MAVSGVELLGAAQEADYVERAWDFTTAWLASNADRFRDNCHQEKYGFYDLPKNQYCVVPAIFKSALTEAGFSVSRTLREFAEKGYLQTDNAGNGKETFLVKKWWGEQRIRMLVLTILCQEGKKNE